MGDVVCLYKQSLQGWERCQFFCCSFSMTHIWKAKKRIRLYECKRLWYTRSRLGGFSRILAKSDKFSRKWNVQKTQVRDFTQNYGFLVQWFGHCVNWFGHSVFSLALLVEIASFYGYAFAQARARPFDTRRLSISFSLFYICNEYAWMPWIAIHIEQVCDTSSMTRNFSVLTCCYRKFLADCCVENGRWPRSARYNVWVNFRSNIQAPNISDLAEISVYRAQK